VAPGKQRSIPAAPDVRAVDDVVRQHDHASGAREELEERRRWITKNLTGSSSPCKEKSRQIANNLSLVPRLRLGTQWCEALPRVHRKREAEPPESAFPGGAWERGKNRETIHRCSEFRTFPEADSCNDE